MSQNPAGNRTRRPPRAQSRAVQVSGAMTAKVGLLSPVAASTTAFICQMKLERRSRVAAAIVEYTTRLLDTAM